MSNPFHLPRTSLPGTATLLLAAAAVLPRGLEEQGYRDKVKPGMVQKNPTYAAMIESVDHSVGRLLAKLDELALTERTVVLFTSDNGGFLGATSNPPLRGGKGQKWEGGIRVPLIVRWPEAVSPGTLCREPVSSIDVYPTILRNDLGETNNLAAMMPGKATTLRDRLHRWRETAGAQMPASNPDYDPGRANR